MIIEAEINKLFIVIYVTHVLSSYIIICIIFRENDVEKGKKLFIYKNN